MAETKVFFIENGNVRKIEIFAETLLGPEKQAFFTASGPVQATVGAPVEIEVEWRAFSAPQGEYVYDSTNTATIKVYDGETVHTLTPIDGRATLAITPDAAGEINLTIIGTTQTLTVQVVETQ
jgi:hypothetical protein